MSVEVEVLSETFAILKQYIPTKDRQEAADNLVSVLVDVLCDEEFKSLADSDVHLMRSAKEYLVDVDDGYDN